MRLFATIAYEQAGSLLHHRPTGILRGRLRIGGRGRSSVQTLSRSVSLSLPPPLPLIRSLILSLQFGIGIGTGIESNPEARGGCWSLPLSRRCPRPCRHQTGRS